MKLTKTIREILDELLTDPDSSARFSTPELLVRAVNTCECDTESEEWSAIRRYPRHNHLGEYEWKLVKFCYAEGIEPLATIGDGIVRRVSKESPPELASRLSIGARIHALTTQSSAVDHFDELWRNVLNAATACDWFAVERLLDLWSNTDEKPNNRTYALICDALAALLHRDVTNLQNLAGRMRNRKAFAYAKAIMNAFVAVADEDAAGFRDAIVKMLKGYKSYMFGDDIDGLIDVHAIGLVNICSRFNPSIAASVDTEYKLPWDRDYFEWSTTVTALEDYFDFPSLPDWLEPHLIRMKPIDWAKQIRQQWSLR